MKFPFATVAAVLAMIPLLNASPAEEKPGSAGQKESLLWKISSGTRTSYIFGTIHMPRKEFEKFPQPVLEALRSCDSFYSEVEPDEKSQVEISKGMQLPPDRTLKAIVGDELFGRAARIAENFDPPVSPAFLNGRKIWGAVLIISYPKKAYDIPLDVLLYQKAKLLGKKTAGIETPSELTGSLDSFTDAEQIEMLKSSVREAEDGFRTVNVVLELYLRQDLQGMAKIFSGIEDGFPEKLKEKYLRTLLQDRNRIFFERLKEQFSRENTFAAVGAGHLSGKDSLLDMLEKAGFKTEPVEFSFPGETDSAGKELLKLLDLGK